MQVKATASATDAVLSLGQSTEGFVGLAALLIPPIPHWNAYVGLCPSFSKAIPLSRKGLSVDN